MADSSGVGTIQHVSKDGRFGFIKLDDMPGVSDLFVFPPACEAFGREVPPVGTRVMFNIVTDEKTGRPRADCVQPAGGDSGGAYAAVAAPHEALPPGRKVGIMTTTNASFGFIRLENGEPDMFCLPPLPPPGARVSFETVMDAKTGRPRAENVHVHVMDMSPSFASGGYGRQRAPAPTPVRSMPYPSNAAAVPSSGAAKGGGGKGKSKSAAATPGGVIWQPPSALPAARGARRTGTVTKVNASFAFIQQDCGEADMFLIPPSCEAFGRELPPVGTRIAYDVIADRFTGRPRAENAEPALGGCGGSAPRTGSHAAVPSVNPRVAAASAATAGEFFTGTVTHTNSKFGFIGQDSGEADMFLIPPACEAFGRELPPVGTRVQYTVVVDKLSGKPRADIVTPFFDGAFGSG